MGRAVIRHPHAGHTTSSVAMKASLISASCAGEYWADSAMHQFTRWMKLQR